MTGGRDGAGGLKSVALALACVCTALLLYTTQLPQHGDGAIGTAMVFAIALAVYLLTLLLAVPLAVRALMRGEGLARNGWLCAAILMPLLVWLLILLWAGAPL